MSTTTSPAVRAAETRRASQIRRLKSAGQWDPTRPSAPVRAYVLQLMGMGLPLHSISKGSGVPIGVCRSLLYGTTRYPDGVKTSYPPSKTIGTEYAEMLMAYRPTLNDYPPNAVVSTVGSRRRLQALATIGWTRRALAARVGSSEDRFNKVMQESTTSAATAFIVRDLYDELWNRGPSEKEVAPAAALRTRNMAARNGWHGPLAWDDDTIDYPQALPRTDAERPAATEGRNVADRWLHGEAVVLGVEDRRQVVQHLMEWTNNTPEEIAERLEISLDTLWQTWSRLKKQARAEGRTEPWRRVYVPRERDLKQNEMGEAA